MNFTTTTEIARKGSKVFEMYDEAIVLNNNKNIGLLLGGKLAQALLDSGVLQQLREELWELNDAETVKEVIECREGNYSNSINLDHYREKHGI